MLGLCVETTAANELGALGAAMSAATALGRFASLEQAVAEMTRVNQRFVPDSTRVAFYEAKFARFSAVTDAMAAACDKSSERKQ